MILFRPLLLGLLFVALSGCSTLITQSGDTPVSLAEQVAVVPFVNLWRPLRLVTGPPVSRLPFCGRRGLAG